ncbi:MAG: prepilin-type N-terminal cleavage/methylation domain-containing protein [Betaproteobacteria bacterium]|nr:prepilin-type N-terminal cleavage/methylation domain-containing protein [Betaproteobacteria bacterium]
MESWRDGDAKRFLCHCIAMHGRLKASTCQSESCRVMDASHMHPSKPRRLHGFTLIESILSIALIAILVGIALPGIELQWLRTRRQDTAGHYTLKVNNASAQGFELEARAVGLQARDTPCAVMSLRLLAEGVVQRSSQPENSDTGRCWPW